MEGYFIHVFWWYYSINFIIKIMAKKKQTQHDGIIDFLTKYGSAISIGVTFWLFTTVNTSKEQNLILQGKYDTIENEIIELKGSFNTFSSQPRFNSSDFEIQTTPIINQVNNNTKKVLSNTEKLHNVENRVIILETNYEKN